MTESQAQQLGRLIKDTRLRRGLSYGELAALSNTDKGWLHKLENGQRADPDPSLLARVAEALRIDPSRIDRISHDHLADSLPSVRTYFRSKDKLPFAAVKEVEAAVAEIRAKYNKSADSEAAGTKASTP